MPDRNPLGTKDAFTLIEIIVVVSLIGIMLFFAVPRIDRSFFADDSRRFSAWLITNVQALKDRAFEKQIKLALYVDLDQDRAWKGPAAAEKGEQADNINSKGISLPEGSHFTDVMFSEQVKVTGGIAVICFYPRGYSDRAIIHVRKNDGSEASYRIESFLPDISIIEGYEEF